MLFFNLTNMKEDLLASQKYGFTKVCIHICICECKVPKNEDSQILESGYLSV